jgi:PLP dependent protein
MKDEFAQIAENLAEIRGRMAAAAARSGRAAGEVALVAVTKFVPVEWIRPLVEAGCCDLGESRPQQLWEKAAALADLRECPNNCNSENGTVPFAASNSTGIRWHLIGHLQRNKVRRTLPLVSMIHSVDTPRLLAALEEEMSATRWGGSCTATPEPQPKGSAVQLPPQQNAQPSSQHRPLPVLLEVNVSGEAAKHGFSPEEIEPFLAALPVSRNISIRGLMCMAALEGGQDVARRDFAALRQLRDRLRPRCPPGVTLDELSMGMSGDFEVAIEEGATIVRVGSALFEGLT